ncbi:MAG: methyltransferase domain-containing protein [Phycisphaerales bacterium]|nr:MAG: methyltransferase domain-containing protein [Phycisphaerales bacterium]
MNQPGTIETGRKDRIVGLYSQARQLAIGRDYAQALELYDKIIADVPRLIFETPRINYERALCLKALGRIEQAGQAIRSCLSVQPDDPEFLRFLSEIQLAKHSTDAMPVVDVQHPGASVSFERRTSQALELCRHGLALAKSGEHTAALAFLDQVLIEYPDVAPKMMGLQLHKGSCLRAVRRFGEAAQAIRNELSLDPNNSRCRKLLNDIQRESECGDLARDEGKFAPVAASSMRCELCNLQCLVFERQFERDWHICPNCNLIRSDVDESQAKVLDKGSPSGSKSPTYGAIHRREEFFCRVFLEQLKLNDILLYGIGWSPVYKNFKEAGYNVVGCDLWRPLIEERNKQFGQGAFYHRDDLPDMKFDVISAFEVFEHFVRPVQEVQLLANHLKDNGIIVGCTDFWHGGSLSKHPNPDRSYWVHKSHVTTWTWKSMNAVAHQFGLKTYYCKTNKRNFAAKVFFVMYKGSKYDQFVQGLPKIFYDVW